MKFCFKRLYVFRVLPISSRFSNVFMHSFTKNFPTIYSCYGIHCNISFLRLTLIVGIFDFTDLSNCPYCLYFVFHSGLDLFLLPVSWDYFVFIFSISMQCNIRLLVRDFSNFLMLHLLQSTSILMQFLYLIGFGI